MKKFPVTSESGVTYEVRIAKIRFYWGVEVRVKGRWFMRTLYRNLYWSHRTDFVEMVKETVSEYENEVESKLLRVEELAENVRKFEDWGGDCR